MNVLNYESAVSVLMSAFVLFCLYIAFWNMSDPIVVFLCIGCDHDNYLAINIVIITVLKKAALVVV